jgi:hypothetical protein
MRNLSGEAAREAQRGVDDARELLGVRRVARVARALQALREALRRRGARDDVAIARARLHELGVVGERLGMRVVGAKARDHLARHAVDVFGGRHLGDLARPAGARLDAEQVERGRAVGMPDLAAPPARFVRGLRHHEGRRDAGGGLGGAGGVGVRRDEGRWRVGGGVPSGTRAAGGPRRVP